jgi:hypothetical protein
MFRHLFRSGNQGRSTRSTFRPVLETLESREVPTSIVTQVSAALKELPVAISNLGLNIQAQNLKNGQANFNIISKDVATLSQNVPSFATNSRLQIDTALFSGGFQLFQDAFQLFQINDVSDGNSVAQLGVQAALSGYFDFLSSLSGISQGNLTLS